MENIKVLRNLIKNGLGLDDAHCYIYNNKWLIPEDKGLFVVIGIINSEVIGNNLKYKSTVDKFYAITSTTFCTDYSIDIFSADISARLKQFELINLLGSFEALQSQERNNYSIARIPSSFTDLSSLEGDKILNRYRATIRVFHKVQTEREATYFDKLSGVRTILNY